MLTAGRMEVSVRKGKWLLLAGLVIMVMTVGCKKMGEPVDIAATEASPMVLPLVMGPSEVLIGHVLMWDDGVDLFVKCTLDVAPPPGVQTRLSVIQFDVELDSTQFPWTSDVPPHINTALFGYQLNPVPYPYQVWRIPGIGGWANTSVVAAMHCVVLTNWLNPAWGVYAAWAKDPNHPFAWGDPDCHGWWFPYKPAPPGDFKAGTAWGGHAMPEWNMWEFPGKNWALYLLYHPLSQTSYVGDLYLGNPKNDPQSHVVGTVTISDNVSGGSGNIVVTYATDPGYSIFNGHTDAAGALAGIPQAKGNPIPGQFDYFFGPFDPTVTSVSVTIPYDPAWGDNVYIGAHAIVGY